MDKLRRLLAEYMNMSYLDFRIEDRVPEIISKQTGFIKWLVDNDKIDIDKVENKANFEFTCNYLYKKDEIEDKLLMLLAISDTPIEDLISYLK